MGFRRLLSAMLFVGAFAFASRSAIAAYCGPTSDTSQLVTLALEGGPADSSRIMDILVVQTYARVDIQSKGRLTKYYVKRCGEWHFSGYALPSTAPSAVVKQMNGFIAPDNGGKLCRNPNFVNHPSGP